MKANRTAWVGGILTNLGFDSEEDVHTLIAIRDVYVK